MKPVAIFRHSPEVGPGYFVEFLDSREIPWQLIAVDEAQPIPADPGAFSGLCFMGGPMSVNDPLPWIAEELALIREAVARDIPVIGHCLGGQLLAKALGGIVVRNPVKEIGWSHVRVEQNPQARQWLGEVRDFPVYQWHGETFTLPCDAVLIMTNDICENQAYVLGPHLGMQCHIEMTEAMIGRWNCAWRDAFASDQALPASVQTPQQQAQMLDESLPAMRAVAARLYAEWVKGLQ